MKYIDGNRIKALVLDDNDESFGEYSRLLTSDLSMLVLNNLRNMLILSAKIFSSVDLDGATELSVEMNNADSCSLLLVMASLGGGHLDHNDLEEENGCDAIELTERELLEKCIEEGYLEPPEKEESVERVTRFMEEIGADISGEEIEELVLQALQDIGVSFSEDEMLPEDNNTAFPQKEVFYRLNGLKELFEFDLNTLSGELVKHNDSFYIHCEECISLGEFLDYEERLPNFEFLCRISDIAGKEEK